MQEKNLNLLRNKINSIDDQILKLIMERSLVVDEIGFFKDGSDKIIDKKRRKRDYLQINKFT